MANDEKRYSKVTGYSMTDNSQQVIPANGYRRYVRISFRDANPTMGGNVYLDSVTSGDIVGSGHGNYSPEIHLDSATIGDLTQRKLVILARVFNGSPVAGVANVGVIETFVSGDK